MPFKWGVVPCLGRHGGYLVKAGTRADEAGWLNLRVRDLVYGMDFLRKVWVT